MCSCAKEEVVSPIAHCYGKLQGTPCGELKELRRLKLFALSVSLSGAGMALCPLQERPAFAMPLGAYSNLMSCDDDDDDVDLEILSSSRCRLCS